MGDLFYGQTVSLPAISVITQQAHEHSGHDGIGGGNAWARQYGLLLTKAHLATGAAASQVCQQQRPTLRPRYGTIPQGVCNLVAG